MYNTTELTDELAYTILDRINRKQNHPETIPEKEEGVYLYDEKK